MKAFNLDPVGTIVNAGKAKPWHDFIADDKTLPHLIDLFKKYGDNIEIRRMETDELNEI